MREKFPSFEQEPLRSEEFYRTQLSEARQYLEQSEADGSAVYKKYPNDRARAEREIEEQIMPERRRLWGDIAKFTEAWKKALRREYSQGAERKIPAGRYEFKVVFPRHILKQHQITGEENSEKVLRTRVGSNATEADLNEAVRSEISMEGLHNSSLKLDKYLEAAEVLYSVKDLEGKEFLTGRCFVGAGGHIVG